jgi:hypothetical protein
MRRPNRSIEVFDISLMAVVTKAMGAFLVLMLLLMPHYKSGPLGEKNAAELAQAVAEADAKLKALAEQLAQASRSPVEFAQLLEETRKQLADAQRLTRMLRSDNEALNSQIQRLEKQEDELKRRLAEIDSDNKKLAEKLAAHRKIAVAGQLLNADCFDVQLDLGLLARDAYVSLKDGKRTTHVLNYGPSFGQTMTTRLDQARIAALQQSGGELPSGVRFNQSTFYYNDVDPRTYFVVLVSRAKTAKSRDGTNIRPLKRTPADCRTLLMLQYFIPQSNSYHHYFIEEVALPKSEYAMVPFELAITDDGVTRRAASPETVAWLRDQIDGAEKEDGDGAASADQPTKGLDKDRLRQFTKDTKKQSEAKK